MNLKLATKLPIFSTIAVIIVKTSEFALRRNNIEYYREVSDIIDVTWLIVTLLFYLTILKFFIVLHSKQK